MRVVTRPQHLRHADRASVRIEQHAVCEDVVLDVQAVVAQTYDAGSYRERIDYTRSCEPPLSDAERLWAESVIRKTATDGAGMS